MIPVMSLTVAVLKTMVKPKLRLFWHFLPLLVYPESHVTHWFACSIQVAHGDEQVTHWPSVASRGKVYPDTQTSHTLLLEQVEHPAEQG